MLFYRRNLAKKSGLGGSGGTPWHQPTTPLTLRTGSVWNARTRNQKIWMWCFGAEPAPMYCLPFSTAVTSL